MLEVATYPWCLDELTLADALAEAEDAQPLPLPQQPQRQTTHSRSPPGRSPPLGAGSYFATAGGGSGSGGGLSGSGSGSGSLLESLAVMDSGVPVAGLLRDGLRAADFAGVSSALALPEASAAVALGLLPPVTPFTLLKVLVTRHSFSAMLKGA